MMKALYIFRVLCVWFLVTAVHSNGITGAPGVMDFQGSIKDPQGQLVTTALPVIVRAQYLGYVPVGNKWCAIYEEAFSVSITNGIMKLRLGDGAGLSLAPTSIGGVDVTAELLRANPDISVDPMNKSTRLSEILSSDEINFETRCIVATSPISSGLSSWADSSPPATVTPSSKALRLHINLPSGAVTPGFSLNALPFAISSKKADRLTGSMGATTNGQVLVWNDTQKEWEAGTGANVLAGAGISIAGDGTIAVDFSSMPPANFSQVALNGSTSGSVNLVAPAISGNYSMVLPPSPGTLNQVLATDGTGVTSWVTAIVQGGNTLGANVSMGSNDAHGLDLRTNNAVRLSVNENGRVGVGTAPVTHSQMAIGGAASSVPNIIETGLAVDLSLSNIHYLKAPGGEAITLSNMTSGATYTLFIADETQRTYTFAGCSNSYFSPANAATSFRSAYTISVIVDGPDTNCFISWATGFN